MGKYWGKDASGTVLPATNSGHRPGDFLIGSVESRAAARAILEQNSKAASLEEAGLSRFERLQRRDVRLLQKLGPEHYLRLIIEALKRGRQKNGARREGKPGLLPERSETK